MASPRVAVGIGVPAGRALIVPVSEPVGASRTELRDAVRAHWGQTRRCATWLASQLYARDAHESSGHTLLTPLSSGLVSDACQLFPALSAAEVVGLARQVQKQYRICGPELIWPCPGAVPTYKCQVVCRLAPERWSLQRGPAGWSISLLFGGRPWVLRLDSVRAKRAHADLRRFKTGTLEKGSIEIYESGTRSGGVSGRTEIVVRIVAGASTKVASRRVPLAFPASSARPNTPERIVARRRDSRARPVGICAELDLIFIDTTNTKGLRCARDPPLGP